MRSLTKMQLAVFEVVRAYIERNGYPPSIRDIQDALGFASPSTAHVHVRALVKKGYLQMDKGKCRTMKVVEEA